MSFERTLVFVATGLVLMAGCSQGHANGEDDTDDRSSEDALAANQETIRAAHRSTWGYDALAPYAQIDANEREAYRRLSVPLDAIGAVIVQNAPFRATASYLGVYGGEHLFAVSEHVALDNAAIAIELGHGERDKLRVPVEPHPIFSSAAGDIAILRASAAAPADVQDRLAALPPVKITFAPASAILEKNPDALAVVAGRAIHGGVLDDATKFPDIYTPAMAQRWKDAQSEADANLDERTNGVRAGDVFAVTPCGLAARGLTQPLRDPDGLTVGSEAAAPFLAARPDWAPESIAATYRSAGRLSGAPVMVVTKRGVFAIGLHWTKGVPSDLHAVLTASATSPRSAFGRVVVKQTGSDAKLSLEAAAPFAYVSSMARAGSDLAAALTMPSTDGAATGGVAGLIAASERPALDALATEAFENSARLLAE